MKRPLITLSYLIMLFLLQPGVVYGQTPTAFSYQSIARDNTGDPITDQALTVRIAFMEGSAGGTMVWEEEHLVTTNSFGLFSIQVGSSGVKTGGTLAGFSDIQWSSNTYWLRPSVYYQAAWYQMDAQQLLSVPYALVARKAEEGQFPANADTLFLPSGSLSIGSDLPGGSKLAVTGQDDLSDDPLFEVKRADGQTVFAVYSDAVRMYVSDGAGLKGPARGGFAVGGFDRAKGGPVKDLMWVTPDSIRMYINDSIAAVKGPRGGFAVGGFDRAKGTRQEFLRVTDDSTRIYVSNYGTKKPRGGFAVGGFDRAKGPATDFLNLTPDNYLIGLLAGNKISSGLYNSFMGYMSGYSTTMGSNNIFLGYKSAQLNISGNHNAIIGNEAGLSLIDGSYNTYMGFQNGYFGDSASYNVFIGYRAGYWNGFTASSGSYARSNVFIGNEAGLFNDRGSNNTFIGYRSGYGISGADSKFNVFVGPETGWRINDGSYNIAIGYQSGYFLSNNSNNILVGFKAGWLNSSGSSNVFIGNYAGYSNSSASSNLFLGNSSGYSNSSGSANTFLGNSTGYKNTTGAGNTFVGGTAGNQNITGSANVSVGQQAGWRNDGSYNVFIGYDNHSSNTSGSRNVSVGNQSGLLNSAGSGNVFLGYRAGWSEMGSDRLYIENSESTTPLIYGEFDTDKIIINGNTGIGADPGSYKLYVAGSAFTTGTWGSSDVNLKTDISPIDNPIDIVSQLSGKRYMYRYSDYPELGLPEGYHFGVIAQEIEKVLPEIVRKDPENRLAVAYTELIPILIEAVNDQQEIINTQAVKLIDLENQNRNLESRLAALESIIANLVPLENKPESYEE